MMKIIESDTKANATKELRANGLKVTKVWSEEDFRSLVNDDWETRYHMNWDRNVSTSSKFNRQDLEVCIRENYVYWTNITERDLTSPKSAKPENEEY